MGVDAVIIGGGPAGASIGRLLAAWGHSVLVLAAASDRSRGLAESLPPSTRKLLAEIGVLDAVDAAGFLPGAGNTAWWASDEPRIETFETPGYQIFRPDFDALLLDCARRAGADVRCAVVRRVDLESAASACVEYDDRGAGATGVNEAGRRTTLRCRFVIDASGRAGVLARRFRQPGDDRVFAYVGVWRSEYGWPVNDPTHTIVETFDDGWAWSVPIRRTENVERRTAEIRHIGVMVGEPGRSYDRHIAQTRAIKRLTGDAILERTFACDASTYSSMKYAGSPFLLAGDAGSFIDPLSSFGVKKALASAWLAAVAVHTSLTHPDRQTVALEFFGEREREMQQAHAARSREFARQAYERHRSAFWERRCAGAPDAERESESAALPPPSHVETVFERFKASPSIDLGLVDGLPLEPRPVVRGREIVVEDAFAGGLRFVGNVDLLKLAEMAPRHRQVPDLFDAYCRDCSPVPLPNVVSGLSLLVAKGILYERTCSAAL